MSAELLLRGAFLNEGEALDAWAALLSGQGLDAVHPECVGLLPLLHRKLEAAGAEHPDLRRLKGVRRRIWLGNQIAFREAAKLLASLDTAGIDTLVLGGLAMLDGYYRDAGLRVARSLELLVRAEDQRRAVSLLGSVPRVQLHRRALCLGCSGRVLEAWWEAATPVRVGDTVSRALCPADQLLHTLVNGARWHLASPTAWMADALAILEDGRVDVARVAGQARELRVTLLVRRTLHRLSAALGVAVAPELAARLAGDAESRADRLEYEYFSRSRRQRPLLSWVVAPVRRWRRSRS